MTAPVIANFFSGDDDRTGGGETIHLLPSQYCSPAARFWIPARRWCRRWCRFIHDQFPAFGGTYTPAYSDLFRRRSGAYWNRAQAANGPRLVGVTNPAPVFGRGLVRVAL